MCVCVCVCVSDAGREWPRSEGQQVIGSVSSRGGGSEQ